MEKPDVIIVGAGVAGVSAAIQLKRFGINFLIFEKNKPCSLLRNANLIENYLGFPHYISGENLANLFVSQFNSFKIRFIPNEIIRINYSQYKFIVYTNNNKYSSKYLILATGSVPVEIPFKSKRIFYEILNLKKKKNKLITIIGSGDVAFDYALSLSVNNNIILVNRSQKIKCVNSLSKKVFNTTNIKYLDNYFLVNSFDYNKKIILFFKHKLNNSILEITSDYLIPAIGRTPNNFLIKKIRNCNNLYLAGDVKNNNFRQTSIASGDGIKAAMDIYLKLNCKT